MIQFAVRCSRDRHTGASVAPVERSQAEHEHQGDRRDDPSGARGRLVGLIVDQPHGEQPTRRTGVVPRDAIVEGRQVENLASLARPRRSRVRTAIRPEVLDTVADSEERPRRVELRLDALEVRHDALLADPQILADCR
jgi:hypothetical protein